MKRLKAILVGLTVIFVLTGCHSNVPMIGDADVVAGESYCFYKDNYTPLNIYGTYTTVTFDYNGQIYQLLGAYVRTSKEEPIVCYAFIGVNINFHEDIDWNGNRRSIREAWKLYGDHTFTAVDSVDAVSIPDLCDVITTRMDAYTGQANYCFTEKVEVLPYIFIEN